MNYVRAAIYAKLETDATLLALLGNGASSIVGDREADSSTVAPFLVVSFNGGRTNFHIGYQTWAIYCEHDKDPNKAAKILKRVRDNLNNQVLSVNSDGGIACMECQFISDAPSAYDRLLRKDVDGKFFRIWVRDI